jgi:WD40 repeat protein
LRQPLLYQTVSFVWLLLAGSAGAADGSLKVWDRRKLPASGSVADGTLHTFNYHSEAIMRVEWHPTERVSMLCYTMLCACCTADCD